MKGAPKLVLVLKGWIVFVLVIATLGHSRPTRKLATSNPGFISIDCGVADDYIDEETGICYKPDRDFVDTGTNYELSSNYMSPNPYYRRQIKNLRSFPQGTRNCYTLKPEQGKNNNYLIRAFFKYGNYDNINQFPKFDLYIGVDYWTTVQIIDASIVHHSEIIHVPSSDTIFVCLLNTGDGVPFISALELRHLDSSSYRIESGGLKLVWRWDMGGLGEMPVRYKDDVYDRLWYPKTYPNYVSINTSSDIDVQGSKDGYEPPAQVLRTALLPLSGYRASSFGFNLEDGEYYVYLHFAEIDMRAQSQKREFNIYWNGEKYLNGPITLDYLTPLSISLPKGSATGEVYLNLTATIGSELPPILNALEIFEVVPLSILSPEPGDDSGNKQHKKILIPIVATLALVSIIISGALAIFWRIKKKRQRVIASKKELSPKPRIQAFNHSDIDSITGHFKTVLGQGGFGKVYHGTLAGNPVAVKLLSLSSSQGYKEFLAEVEMGVHHKNLVSLVGYCDDGETKALICEFMAKGNLQQYLLEESTITLDWKQRLRIAVDAARGLEYIHNSCTPPIVHRDIKTANILLNDNWEAKIADFGLSKIFANESASSVSTDLRGTSGYADPEYVQTGQLTIKSDVYSFGVVLLELITGQPAKLIKKDLPTIPLTRWVRPLYESKDTEGIVDRRLQATYNINVAWKAIELAVECVKSTASERPDISEVHDKLKDCLKIQMNSETTRST